MRLDLVHGRLILAVFSNASSCAASKFETPMLFTFRPSRALHRRPRLGEVLAPSRAKSVPGLCLRGQWIRAGPTSPSANPAACRHGLADGVARSSVMKSLDVRKKSERGTFEALTARPTAASLPSRPRAIQVPRAGVDAVGDLLFY